MPLLSCSQALELVAEKMRSLLPLQSTEHASLQDTHGRVLAQTLAADRDQPPFPRSTRDGYAVRAASARGALALIGAIRAGEQWTGADLLDGQAIEIMTGAPVPGGADAVVMLEHVALAGETLSLGEGRTVRAGENIVPRAAEARAGDALLLAGTRLGAAEIALAASIGAAEIMVYPKPEVAILSTGDELVPVHATPGPTQIRNSNAYGLAALVRAHGGTSLILPPAGDTREALGAAIAAARGAKMLLLSGGVSAGKYDLVEDALLALGAEFFFTGVAMQPGKPAVFGRIPPQDGRGEQWVFGLPGNPVSTQVTGLLFAMPLLRALGGEGVSGPDGRQVPRPIFAQAQLQETVQVRPGLTRFLPAYMASTLGGASVRTTGWQGSGDLNANARANCYLVVPPAAESLLIGDFVSLLLRG